MLMTYKQLIKYYKSQTAAAKAIGIRPPSVNGWKRSGIPDDRQMQYQNLSGGKLKADPAVVQRYQELLGLAA